MFSSRVLLRSPCRHWVVARGRLHLISTRTELLYLLLSRSDCSCIFASSNSLLFSLYFLWKDDSSLHLSSYLLCSADISSWSRVTCSVWDWVLKDCRATEESLIIQLSQCFKFISPAELYRAIIQMSAFKKCGELMVYLVACIYSRTKKKINFTSENQKTNNAGGKRD